MAEPESSDIIVVHNCYYANPGQAKAVYQWRLHACEMRAQLGFPRGRVLRRFQEVGEGEEKARPDVIWECTYPSLSAREQDAKAVEATPEFRAVMQHMRTLIRSFNRQLWRVDASTSLHHDASTS